jgi:hypothetical protein
MSKSHRPFDDSLNQFEALEAKIRAAGNYVVPSDDLRPRTLEDAGELVVQRRWLKRLGFAWMMCTLVVGLSLVFVGAVNVYREAWVTPSGDDLQRIAFENSSTTNAEREWGLVEVFDRLRRLRFHDLENKSRQDIEAGMDLSSLFR